MLEHDSKCYHKRDSDAEKINIGGMCQRMPGMHYYKQILNCESEEQNKTLKSMTWPTQVNKAGRR